MSCVSNILPIKSPDDLHVWSKKCIKNNSNSPMVDASLKGKEWAEGDNTLCRDRQFKPNTKGWYALIWSIESATQLVLTSKINQLCVNWPHLWYDKWLLTCNAYYTFSFVFMGRGDKPPKWNASMECVLLSHVLLYSVAIWLLVK